MQKIEEAQSRNIAKALRDGPGLSYGYSTWIEAKCSRWGAVLIGGLGGFGVGKMWAKEDPKFHATYEGYVEAKDHGCDDKAEHFGLYPSDLT